ncbi:microtubule-associated protein futsch isoform X3 [Aricia agestis]|uniref:microtubule-associated protein futsch isoform X3 n=1 Tax=Aricia agestis TaxID=91739 RepID=UPI001C2032CB|nr:microtubule-associated protein futsch isoform X3 [Aricia agestis]
METSEEDAGASANASRRVSAREKDVGRIEDVDATNIAHQEPSEPRASNETNAMSEDNFDGDSVPSPSTQDVNTSTEAILDMIDEIVDGPGAPKRLSESPEQRSDAKTDPKNPPVTDVPTESDEPICSTSVSVLSSETNASEPQSEITENVSNSQATSSELETSVSTETTDNTEPVQSCSKEISVSSVTDSPSSSEVTSEKDCGPSERTVQSAALCDKNDKINIESAVSTSSDNNHDSRDSSVSVSTRSPLRRRLVRPVPSRPDSTVTSSSSVDSSVNSEVTQSECAVKDVSSSSDVVTTLNESKPEEIRNISEVSPCRAETSMGSPKKIRLIRQKLPQTNVDNVDVKKERNIDECHLLSTNSQCQGSQATKPQSSSLPEETVHSNVELPSKDLSVEAINIKQDTLEVKAQENTQESIEGCKESHNEASSIEKTADEPKKVPPIKLNLPVKESPPNTSNLTSGNEISTPCNDSDNQKQVPKLTIKIGSKPSEEMKSPIPKLTIKTLRPPESECKNDSIIEQISVEKSQEIKSPIPKLTIKTLRTSESESKNENVTEQIIVEKSEEMKSPIPKLTIKTLRLPETECKNESFNEQKSVEKSDETKSPIPKLTIKTLRPPESECKIENVSIEIPSIEKSEEKKSPIPKLTIKTLRQPELVHKNENVSEETSSIEKSEEQKSPIPKLTIKTLRSTESEGKNEMVSEVMSTDKKSEEMKSPIPKLTIKTMRPPESDSKTENVSELCSIAKSEEMKSPIPKLTIKTMRPPETDTKSQIKLPEKINELHRKSSSSEISESECSENDESSNTSDQASTSDHGPSDVVPKVTIKLGKPGTVAEGQFYTEKNSSKSTVKTIQSSECEAPLSPSKMQVFISQPDEMQSDKIPKLTIKTVTSSKFASQPLSPKLTIKPIRPPDTHQDNVNSQDTETNALTEDSKDNLHVPKITIKAIPKPDSDLNSKSKKSHHIVPLVKPTDSIDIEENDDNKVPVVSKSNIKSIVKPNDSVIESSKDDIPKIPKLNIKLVKNPALNSCQETVCDDLKVEKQESNIPVVKKINIKPIIKPSDADTTMQTKKESPEIADSRNENADNIVESTRADIDNTEENVPVVSKLRLKLNIKPEETSGPSSPKSPNITKLNIKPIIKPDELKEKNDELSESHVKNPPLLLKINMKMAESHVGDQLNLNKNDYGHCNNIDKDTSTKLKPIFKQNTDFNLENVNKEIVHEKESPKVNCHSPKDSISKANKLRSESDTENPVSISAIVEVKQNCDSKSDINPHVDQSEKDNIQEDIKATQNKQDNASSLAVNSGVLPHTKTVLQDCSEEPAHVINTSNTNDLFSESIAKSKVKHLSSKQNCTLLKKLLESNTDSTSEDKNITRISTDKNQEEKMTPKHFNSVDEKLNIKHQSNVQLNHDDLANDKKDLACNSLTLKSSMPPDKNKRVNENLTKPLEISVSEKLLHSPDQDSPRIILKINKVDLTSKTSNDETNVHNASESPGENMNEKQGKNLTNRRKKVHVDTPMPDGKRLRSSRVVNSVEKGQISKQILNKRPSTDKSPPQKDLKLLDTKRMKLGHLISTKTIAPITSKDSSLSPPTKIVEEKQDVKILNHTLLNNENCAKNGSSKLHNILTNLQNKQLHNLPFNDLTHRENNESPDLKSSTSTGSIEIEIERTSPIRPKIHEMIFQESSESRDFNIAAEEMLKDPLAVDTNIKDTPSFLLDNSDIPKTVDMTPQPKKRGRPRKIPLSEGAKTVQLPVMALEERPQRSLRLSRERPPLVVKPRGRGRGRGRRLTTEPKDPECSEDKKFQPVQLVEPKQEEEIDPTSSRIKLPRMTEALDKMPCSTPLSSRRRNSSSSDLLEESQDFKGDMETDTSLPKMENPFLKSPEMFGSGRSLRGRGSRGGRGRPAKTPRGRGRGRGGGRGAMYMKETMGIYGRVCGPATTTVQLFEEETCMMDDNATPSKPAHLLDEDSQSSVKSSTNESSKMKKSKFADLFDSNKIWTADDVKEYTWPLEDSGNGEHQVMMIQEQVAMFLGIKSFKRRYPELKRRTITGDERNYVLQKGLVTEALCDLGITAVDASEVLDIMLSDYPHKYEEYRSHQRIKQLNEPEPEEIKVEVKVERVEIKPDAKPTESKPEPPKVDPEKLRLEMAAAAVASASEWNTRMNTLRRGACADLQSLTVLRRRAPPPAPVVRVRPPAGFYPHALLPGQYQHTYRRYTPQELRYFPLNTVTAAPPPPPSPVESSSESEQEWGSQYTSSDDSDTDTHRNAKRKKLTKTKRISQDVKEEEVDLCRKCGLRLEANRKYTHERFLVCATCNCKLHPGCVDLQPDTIRKAREYAWQCAECKTCGGCARPAGDIRCDLCDRAYHTTCLGLQTPPSGRWHCVDCSVCKSCGARSPAGLGADDAGMSTPGAGTSTPGAGTSTPGAGTSTPGAGTTTPIAGTSTSGNDEPRWHHQTRRGPGGHKVYSHSLCTPCASKTKRRYSKKRIRSPIVDEGL